MSAVPAAPNSAAVQKKVRKSHLLSSHQSKLALSRRSLFSPFSRDAASYDEGSSEGHGSLDGGAAGIWPNEPCLFSDEPTALPGYVHLFPKMFCDLTVSWTSYFILSHAVDLHFTNVFAPPRICFRKKHSIKAHAAPTASLLGLQHASSQRQR